jgi:hypothetical protein
MNRDEGEPDRTKSASNEDHDERESISVTAEDCTNIVSSPRYHEEIDYGEIELAAGKFQMSPSHPHRQSKLERVKISQKFFAQLNKLRINNCVLVIAGTETWVYFENPGFTIWVGADIRRPIRPKQPMGARNPFLGVVHPHRNCRHLHVAARRIV